MNVGAGAITCNYDGKHKHLTTIGDGRVCRLGLDSCRADHDWRGGVCGCGQLHHGGCAGGFAGAWQEPAGYEARVGCGEAGGTIGEVVLRSYVLLRLSGRMLFLAWHSGMFWRPEAEAKRGQVSGSVLQAGRCYDRTVKNFVGEEHLWTWGREGGGVQVEEAHDIAEARQHGKQRDERDQPDDVPRIVRAEEQHESGGQSKGRQAEKRLAGVAAAAPAVT